MKRLLFVLIAVSSGTLSLAGENLLVNGDFEHGLQGWAKIWSREPGVKAAIDEQSRHGGRAAVRIEHSNPHDWSLAHAKRLDVKPGEIYELSGWLRTQGEGDVALSVTLYDAKQQAIAWEFGARGVRGTTAWRQVQSRFMIPPDGPVSPDAARSPPGPTIWRSAAWARSICKKPPSCRRRSACATR